MSVVTFPNALATVQSMTWTQTRNDVEYRSIFGAQAVEVTGALWAVSVVGAPFNDALAGAWKALLMQLRGRTNQLALWDLVRPVPIGTMRGTLTFNTGPAQGATSLSVTGGAGQAATTLVQGDLLGVGSGLTQQVVMVVANATADGSGVIALTTEPALRNPFNIGDPVTWNQPMALFRRSSPASASAAQAAAASLSAWDYANALVTGFSLDLMEDWRP